MFEDETPEPERHEEHHETHAGRDAEEAGKSFQDARVGAGRGQHDIAGTWRDGGHDGEEKKRHDLLRSRAIPPRIGQTHSGPVPRMRAMRLEQTRSRSEERRVGKEGRSGWSR